MEEMKRKKTTTASKVAQFLGLNRSIGSMLVMVVLLGMGEKMGERFLPVYILAVGGSSYAVGFLNAMDNFLSAIYAYLGGRLSDALGYKKALMLYTLIAMAGYSVIVLFPSWVAVLAGSVLFISWTAISLPAIMSLVSSTVRREKVTMGVSLHSLIRRIPMALGPILGGALISAYGIQKGSRMAFGGAFVLGVAALWFIGRFVEDRPAVVKAQNRGFFESFAAMPSNLKVLLASDILIRFAEQIPYAFVVVWVMKVNGQPALAFSALTLIEMVTAMLVYIPVAYLEEKSTSKLVVSITFGFFAAFPAVLLVSRTFPMLVFAFIIRGLKEFGEPTRKALIVKLAPEGAKASTFGAYYLARDIFVTVAALSSAWLWEMSPKANFLTAAAFGVAGLALFIIFGKDAGKAGA